MRLRRALVTACLCAAAAQASFAATVQVEVQDDAGRPLPRAAVYLESAEAKAALKPGATAEIEQAGRQFRPMVTVVPTGTLVRFPNRDRIRHQVYSFSPAKKFELKLYAGSDAEPVLFDHAGVVALGCNIHDDMMAWVVVVDTPYYVLSDASGTATLPDVPPGNYRLRVWHTSLPASAAISDQPLPVAAAGAKALVRLAGAKP